MPNKGLNYIADKGNIRFRAQQYFCWKTTWMIIFFMVGRCPRAYMSAEPVLYNRFVL
jgi:hypothetical protein